MFFAKLGLNGMANYDDCYYAEKGKEILKTGNWVVQTYNYHLSFTNAPLFQCLEALSFKLFGVSVFAAKFPSALMGFSTVILLYFLGKHLFDPWIGFFSAFILALTYPFLKYGRHAMQDVTETFFVVLAMTFLILAVRKSDRFFWLWGVSIGLAIWTKSAMGFFPLIGTVLFLVLTRKWKIFTSAGFWGGVLTLSAMVGAWVWSQYSADPRLFMDEHVKNLILSKFTDGAPDTWYAHFNFLRDLLIYDWPWLPFLVYGFYLLARRDFQNRETVVFLFVWSLTATVIISVSHFRFMWYYMQIFPAFAIVSAIGLSRVLSSENRLRAIKIIIAGGLLAAVLVNVLPIPLDKDREKDTRTIAPYVKHYADNGAKVIALREEFYGLNNALLFFSDHAAEPLYTNVSDVQKEFASPQTVLCVAHQGDLAEIQKSIPVWYPVKYGGDLILISNKNLEGNNKN